MRVFVNREAELVMLNRMGDQPGAALFILYGRRRLGKTELLRRWVAGKRHLFFVADRSPDRDQLALFSQRLWELAHGRADEAFTFPSWEGAFRYVAELARAEPLVVVLDEFPYLVEANRALPSVLQRLWDEELQHTRVRMILCGSTVSVMEREVLARKAALYGRRTGQYRLSPLRFKDLKPFFPDQTATHRIEAYAVLGGVPAYLLAFSGENDLFNGIADRILTRGSFLYDEPRFLLMEELREPAYYFSLLRAMAGGKTRPNELAQSSALADRGAVSRYLDTLRDLELVERRVPATEEMPHKSRKGLWLIRDPFVRFWFRFVFPNYSDLEEGDARGVLDRKIRPHFDDFVGPSFEDLARECVWTAGRGREELLGFRPHRVGGWWGRQAEIDVVAFDDEREHLAVGEGKWSQRPVGLSVLRDLQAKTTELLAETRGRWRRPPQVRYLLFSRAGFTEELRERAAGSPSS